MTAFLAMAPSAPLLILATAGGYALATVGIRSFSVGEPVLGLFLGLAGFLLAFAAEVVLLRRLELSVIYILIVAAETLLVLAYAHWIGEGFGLRQTLGAMLVLAGLVAVSA